MAEPAPIGIGLLGYEFMGRAHASAYRTIPDAFWPPPLRPRLVALAGRTPDRVAAAARRYGFERSTTDWRELVADEKIGLFDDSGPNALHAEPTIAAARAGKHLLCEKPLGRDAAESHAIWAAADEAGVVHMCGFNYRFVPAVRLAREMLEAGDLGEVHSFHGHYRQDWLADPRAPHSWRLDRAAAGSGALGDIGSHLIDLARFLVGEVVAVAGRTRTVVADRPGGRVDVDDAVEAVVELDGGVAGTISATRLAHGRKNDLAFEVHGSRGSLTFDLERLNELHVHLDGSEPGARAQG
ncbi:MAG: Gfo/Idh/MocA family oxidoreductase, partial [Solirubrobacterales bacterium]|nr:Gfo/Idh/MocA family oxidoreductase [Solirubrobacterales bacterium]